jgi:chromosome segregation ATPase
MKWPFDLNIKVEREMRISKHIMLKNVLVSATTFAISVPTLSKDKREGGTNSMSADCKKDKDFYVVIGRGKNDSKDMANQLALVDARKSALLCIFGGTISYKSNTAESNTDVETSASTTITLSSEHIDWSGFEMIDSKEDHQDEVWTVELEFHWSIKDVSENKKRTDKLNKEKEKNKSLSAEIVSSQKIAAERARLIEKQKKELEDLKKQETELANLKSESERVLVKLNKIKADRKDKNAAWLNMVLQFGCGTTLADLKKTIGAPRQIKIMISKIQNTYKDIYTPSLYFIYGDYAFEAIIHDVTARSYDDLSYLKREANRYEISSVREYKGGTKGWYICQH